MGYAASIFIFSQIVRELNMSLPKFTAIFCHSQKMLPGQREKIEEIFGGRVFTHYAQAEKVILAAECEYSHDYHIVPEFGYAELLDSNGQIIKSPNVTGELVGTGFYNKIMPLIRYKTGDLGAYREEQNCRCGRPHIILATLRGRTQDFLILKDGTMKGTAAGARAFFIFAEYCRGFQLMQETPGKVEVRIVPKSDNPPDYKEKIYKEIKEKFFGEIEIEIVETSNLEKSHSGKPKFLIQKLKTPKNHEESITYLIPEE
jgi:phenylacetate-CoA ligase